MRETPALGRCPSCLTRLASARPGPALPCDGPLATWRLPPSQLFSPLLPTGLCSAPSHRPRTGHPAQGAPSWQTPAASAERPARLHLLPLRYAVLTSKKRVSRSLLSCPCTRTACLRTAGLHLGKEWSVRTVSPHPASGCSEGRDHVFAIPVRSPTRVVTPWRHVGAVEWRNDGRTPRSSYLNPRLLRILSSKYFIPLSETTKAPAARSSGSGALDGARRAEPGRY